MDLNGKVAIITGGGRGIGRAVALDMAREGCHLVLSSRSRKELSEVAAAASAMGVEVVEAPLDLSVEANVTALVEQALAKFGVIDILINNAGVIFVEPFLEATLERWDQTMNLNLRGVFLLSQQVLRQMATRRSGYIINISSTVALGVPPQVASYGVSKCGMVGLSQALYEEAKQHGVKVSTIYPGITDTRMVRDLDLPTTPDQWMLPEDISYCVMFLLKQSDRMIVKDLVPWSTSYDRI